MATHRRLDRRRDGLYGVGRRCGVGRGRGVTLGVALGVVLGVAVGVSVGVVGGVVVGVAVAVAVAVAVTVGAGLAPHDCAQLVGRGEERSGGENVPHLIRNQLWRDVLWMSHALIGRTFL